MTGAQHQMPEPPRTWTVLSMIEWSRDYLAGRGFEEGRLHAELLLGHVLKLDRLHLYLQFDRPLTPAELGEYRELFKRRLTHEPLQYILGEAAFMGITLGVGPGVLVPRPETELLVERTLARVRDSGKPGIRILDVGTGSGNIALALAHHSADVRVTGVDISAAAIARSRSNAERLSITAVEFIHADVFAGGCVDGRFDIVAANPPYISRNEFETLMPEVRMFEPREALTDEDDGYGFLQRLVPRSRELLERGGAFLCEIGYGQGARAREIVEKAGFALVRVHADYAGIPRVVEAELE